jgi:hypothetical protein
MKILLNILNMVMVLFGIGLLTMGYKIGVIINLISLICMIILFKKRNLIRE